MTRKAFVVALLLTLASNAEAQKSGVESNTRSVEGVVTDAADKPVQGAVVQLKDTKTLQIRSFYTQADGVYHFAGLSTNVDYQLDAALGDARSGSKTLSNFDSHKVAKINLKLKK